VELDYFHLLSCPEGSCAEDQTVTQCDWELAFASLPPKADIHTERPKSLFIENNSLFCFAGGIIRAAAVPFFDHSTVNSPGDDLLP
jgi:hypothetical protein